MAIFLGNFKPSKKKRMEKLVLPLIIIVIFVFAIASFSYVTGAQGAYATTAGDLELIPTFESIGVYSSFSGDENGNNFASLDYRVKGSANWIKGMDMTPDRRSRVGDGFSNPNINEWRASILLVHPNTNYEVRVTYTDPDGVSPSSVTGSVKTRNDVFPSNGRTLYVDGTNGNDNNAGTSINAAFKTFEAADSAALPGDKIYVRGGTYQGTITLDTPGEPDNYITWMTYPGETVTIQAANTYAGFKVENSYIVLHGFTVIGGGRIDSSYTRGGGVWIGPSSTSLSVPQPHDCVIEDMIIKDSKTLSGSSGGYKGILLGGWSNGWVTNMHSITIQRNTIEVIQPPDKTPVSGPAIHLLNARGRHIIRDNIITYKGTIHVHGMDCIVSSPNFELDYTARDTDVYNNYCYGATDDGISLDGNAANLRIWDNTISHTNVGISVAPVILGPAYIFRNVFVDPMVHWVGTGRWNKGGEDGTGHTYFYHNTVVYDNLHVGTTTPGGSGKDSAANYGYSLSQGGGGESENVFSLNNIIEVDGPVCADNEPEPTMDYDLIYNHMSNPGYRNYWTLWEHHLGDPPPVTNAENFAEFQQETGQELHGVPGRATFVDRANKDFHLAQGSLGIDQGVVIRGFNDENSPWPYTGNAPDIGAYEYDSGYVATTTTTTTVPTTTTTTTTIPTTSTTTTTVPTTTTTSTTIPTTTTTVPCTDCEIQVNFTNPTDPNGAAISRDWTYINMDVISSSPIDSFKINWDGTDITTYGNGLVGLWHFDNNVVDYSGQGNDGTLNGATWTTGKFENALSFDGVNDYVNLGNPSSLSITDSITLEAWVYVRSIVGSYDKILSKGDRSYALELNTDSNTFTFSVYDTTWRKANCKAITTNEWVHIAATFDGSTMKCYANGVKGTDGTASYINSNSYAVYIGGNSQYSQYFDGIVDEVRIYNRALSQAEIQANYQATFGRYYIKQTNLEDGTYNYYALATNTGGNSAQTETRTLNVGVPACSDCGLSTPIINPTSPQINQTFTISCPASKSGYDCLRAFVGNTECSYSTWSGLNAVFNCAGKAAGSYIAKCQSITGTTSNCCSDEKTKSFGIGIVCTDNDNDGYCVPEDCNDNNDSIYPNATEICDGKDNDCDGNVDEGFKDTDNDGIADCMDEDDDNDGISNENDFIRGDSTKINTTIDNIQMEINGSSNPNNFEGPALVKFKDSTHTLVEFEIELNNESKLDCTDITIIPNSNNETGSILIKGIDLTSQGKTKTVYVDNLNGITTLCIKDDEITSITQLSSLCNGADEYGIKCPGTANNNKYNCAFTDNTSTIFKITGLDHTGIQQQKYCGDGTCSSDIGESCSSCATDCGSCPSGDSGDTGGGGGSGGGGGRGYIPPTTIPDETVEELKEEITEPEPIVREREEINITKTAPDELVSEEPKSRYYIWILWIVGSVIVIVVILYFVMRKLYYMGYF